MGIAQDIIEGMKFLFTSSFISMPKEFKARLIFLAYTLLFHRELRPKREYQKKKTGKMLFNFFAALL